MLRVQLVPTGMVMRGDAGLAAYCAGASCAWLGYLL